MLELSQFTPNETLFVQAFGHPGIDEYLKLVNAKLDLHLFPNEILSEWYRKGSVAANLIVLGQQNEVRQYSVILEATLAEDNTPYIVEVKSLIFPLATLVAIIRLLHNVAYDETTHEIIDMPVLNV